MKNKDFWRMRWRVWCILNFNHFQTERKNKRDKRKKKKNWMKMEKAREEEEKKNSVNDYDMFVCIKLILFTSNFIGFHE